MEGEELSHWYLTVGGALYDPGGGSLFLPMVSCSYLINTPCSPRELWKDSSRGYLDLIHRKCE